MKISRSHAPATLVAWALGLVLALAAFAPQAAPRPPQTGSWTITTLGSLGPRGAIALAINNRGDIGGYSAVVQPGSADWHHHAFLWQNGTMLDLGAQLGSGHTQVSAINDRGTAVITGNPGLWIWRDGQWTATGIQQASANDTNNKGVIVGSYLAGFAGHAYAYSDGVLRDLGTLGGTTSGANAINDKGVIVGVSWIGTDTATRGFVYENGAMREIGTFGGASSTASDINSHGVIVGNAQDASGTWQPYIIDRAGMRLLPNVPAGSTLHAINDRGVIVGTYANANNQGTTSFVWEDGVMTPLEVIPEVQAAGWSSLFVTDINDRGWITGWGWKAGGSPEGEAFLLVPR